MTSAALHIVRTGFTLFLLAVGPFALAQVPLKFTFRSYDLADDSSNFIQNAETNLDPFS